MFDYIFRNSSCVTISSCCVEIKSIVLDIAVLVVFHGYLRLPSGRKWLAMPFSDFSQRRASYGQAIGINCALRFRRRQAKHRQSPALRLPERQRNIGRCSLIETRTINFRRQSRICPDCNQSVHRFDGRFSECQNTGGGNSPISKPIRC